MKKGCQQLNSTGLGAVLAPKESQIAGLGFSWWSCLWSECLQKLQWEKSECGTERLCVVIERRDKRSCWTGVLNQTTI